MSVRIFGALILAAFYAVYFGKMTAQRRRGIQTDQMGSNKAKGKVYYTELCVKVTTILVVAAEVVSVIADTHRFGGYVRAAGLVIAALGTIAFAAAVFTMRDSWRAGIAEKDKTEFVSSGIYKFSRNPAFLGFDLCYIGILLAFFNLPLLLFTVAGMTALHFQILCEESYLPTVFGQSYLEYKARTNRYLGRKKLF